MADIDPPWRLDPLQTIVDVHWTEIFALATWVWQQSLTSDTGGTCLIAPGVSVTQDTITFSLTGPTVSQTTGFTVSGSPSVSPDILSFAPWTWGPGLSFEPGPGGIGSAGASGTTPGSHTFDVIGHQCGGGGSIDVAGSITVTVPPGITMTETASGDVYHMLSWNIVAGAGVLVTANFELSST